MQCRGHSAPPCAKNGGVEPIQRLHSIVRQTARFRERLRAIGLKPLDRQAAIVPIIVGKTAFAIEFSPATARRSVLSAVSGIPVVPEGTARAGVQMSAAIEEEHMEQVLGAFEKVGRELELV
jgi:glycine C-acetyltransferase